MEPFVTAHTRGFPHPFELAELLDDREDGKSIADFDEAVRAAVELTVRRWGAAAFYRNLRPC
jgi:hypothetical protein